MKIVIDLSLSPRWVETFRGGRIAAVHWTKAQPTQPARTVDSVYDYAYTCAVRLEWDPKKAATNLRKHGVRFTDAYAVREDELALTQEDPHPDERRQVTIGLDSMGRVLVVNYTWRGDNIRIISVRKATPGERRQYEDL